MSLTPPPGSGPPCPACGLPADHAYHEPGAGGADWPRFNHHFLMAVYEEARADERDEIIRLAVEHGAAYYAEPRPCGHKADCSLVTRDRVPFAELIRKERGND